jgi:hypothetical protein
MKLAFVLKSHGVTLTHGQNRLRVRCAERPTRVPFDPRYQGTIVPRGPPGGDCMAGPCVEAVYNEIQDPTIATVVFIIIGSDETQIKKRLSAHPLYISAGNFPTHVRMTRDAWKVAGFVQELCSTGNRRR